MRARFFPPIILPVVFAVTLIRPAPAFCQEAAADAAVQAPAAAPVKNLSPEEAKARLKRFVLPVYPESEKPASLTRTVEIGVEISSSGETTDLRVVSGAPALAPAAWNAARQWIFAPAGEGNAPVTARMRFLVRFKSDNQIEVLAVHPLAPDSFGDPGASESAPNWPSALIYGVSRPGQDGVGYPTCLSCPEPGYTEQARRNRIEGKVVMETIITEQGYAVNIRLLESLGYGLDEQAIQAVQRWRFRPALDAQGQAVVTLTLIEITFRLVRDP